MRRYSNIFQTVLIALLANLLIVQLAFSMRWTIAHDAAPLLYESFLMQTESRVPYRDIVDFQMPGAFLAYYALGLISGFGVIRLRIIDIGMLAALLTITFLLMRRFGKPAALTAAILFGLKYMQGGAYMSLQREYLLLFLIAIAVWMNLRDDLNFKIRLITGFLFGLAATIKPHAALGLLPILIFDLADLIKRPRLTPLRAAAIIIPPLALGFSIPILSVIAWLASTGALFPFIDIASNYWALYSQINGYLEVTDSATRFHFLWTRLLYMDGNWVWLMPSVLGIYFLPQDKKRPAYFLASLALCYAIYPALSGQFFTYHYIPFVYFIVLLASLALAGTSGIADRNASASIFFSNFRRLWTPLSALAILLIAILVNVRPSSTFARQLNGQPISPTTGRADRIARYLEDNLKDGDTVQPLDWTGGALLAMLKTRAHIATPYVFDFYFYHHVSNPYIQGLRVDFMKKLQAANPRFIIEVIANDKPWVSGVDTSREFPELREFLNENYLVVIGKDDVLIYERR